MPTWTNVPKPTSSVWTFPNAHGREFYNQFDVTYDDPLVFYDGSNPSAWTSVSKPGAQSWISVSKPT